MKPMKSILISTILVFCATPMLLSQIDSSSVVPYGQVVWETYPKPWNEYPHDTLVHKTITLTNQVKYPDIACRVTVIEYHLPNDFPSIYQFSFFSPSISSWHFEVIDTSYESESWFSFQDLNFDGYKDLRYRVSPKVRCEFPAWLFNRALMTFQYDPSFDCLPQELELKDRSLYTSGYSFYSGSRSDWSEKDTVIHNETRVVNRSDCIDYSTNEDYSRPDSSRRKYEYYTYRTFNNAVQLIRQRFVLENLSHGEWHTTESIDSLVGNDLKRLSNRSYTNKAR